MFGYIWLYMQSVFIIMWLPYGQSRSALSKHKLWPIMINSQRIILESPSLPHKLVHFVQDGALIWQFYAIWAAKRQNQQNDMCAQRRLRSAWVSAQSDQSSLWAQKVVKDPIFLHADSEADLQADLSLH